MENKVLLGKLLIALAGAFVCAVGANSRVQSIPRTHYLSLTFGYLLVSRFLVFISIYVVFHEHAQSDVPAYYYPQARDIIRGLLPYKGFTSSYAPLFPYIASVPVRIAHTPIAIVGLAIFFELVAFPIWVAFVERVSSQRIARLSILLYVTSPIAIINVAIDGQNQVWISCFLAAALLLTVVGKPLAAGGALATSIAAVKFLPMIVAPAFLLRTRDRDRGLFLGGFLVLLIIVYGVFLLLGADVFSPLRSESSDYTSGNVPYLFSLFTLHPNVGSLPRLENVGTAVCLCAVYILAWARTRTNRRPDYESLLVVLFFLTVMLVSKKAYTDYLEMALFPLCMVVASGPVDSLRIGLFNLFGALVVLEPSLWFRWLEQRGLRTAFQTTSGMIDHAKIGAFILFEVLLIGLYAFYWWQTWSLARTREPTQQTTAIGSTKSLVKSGRFGQEERVSHPPG